MSAAVSPGGTHLAVGWNGERYGRSTAHLVSSVDWSAYGLLRERDGGLPIKEDLLRELLYVSGAFDRLATVLPGAAELTALPGEEFMDGTKPDVVCARFIVVEMKCKYEDVSEKFAKLEPAHLLNPDLLRRLERVGSRGAAMCQGVYLGPPPTGGRGSGPLPSVWCHVYEAQKASAPASLLIVLSRSTKPSCPNSRLSDRRHAWLEELERAWPKTTETWKLRKDSSSSRVADYRRGGGETALRLDVRCGFGPERSSYGRAELRIEDDPRVPEARDVMRKVERGFRSWKIVEKRSEAKRKRDGILRLITGWHDDPEALARSVTDTLTELGVPQR